MAQPPNKARDEDVWLPAHRDDRGPLDGASNHLSVDAKNDDLSTEGWAANYQSAGEGQRLLGQLETAAHWLRGALRVDPDARAAVAVGTFAAGIIGYFHLPREPALGVMLATLILLLALFLRTRARGGLTGMRVAAAGCLLLAGAVLAQLQVLKVQSPMLAKPVTVRVTATVLFAELRADGRQRVDLLLHSAERADAKTLPKKVRLVLRQEALLPAGATVTGLARLMPHTGPAYPGGYDFGFGHYFEGRGALGFSMGTFELATDADPVALSWMMQAKIIQSQLRSVLAARIREGLPGEAGHVAVALITGERQAISDETNESLRASGMAHILAISGLHMTLIVG
ncbi:MAG: ComEC/Rec2 family competence protein, partial [Pseudomonadota bacterium]